MKKFDTIGPRFLASIIDILIMIPVGIMASALTIITPENSKLAFLSGNLVSLVSVFYYILMHARFGQTLGKMVLKVKVLDISERPITFTQAVIRSLPQMLPIVITASLSIFAITSPDMNEAQSNSLGIVSSGAYILYSIWSIGDCVSALVTEKNRALHDLIAGTVVVKTNV